jgi:hypothetical protein
VGGSRSAGAGRGDGDRHGGPRPPAAAADVDRDHRPPRVPWPTTRLLDLIGGFLALAALKAEVDASSAVAGIVAAGSV